MITTVTLNPAIDRTIVVKDFQFGAVNRIASVREDMGGKGINVARILLALGTPVRVLGFLGQENLAQVEALMERDSLPADFVLVPGTTRLNTKLLDLGSQTTTDLNEAGFTVSSIDLAALTSGLRSHVSQSDFVIFSGSVPPGLPVDIYRTMINDCGPACRTVLDADGPLLREGLKAQPFLIKPNIQELESALDRPLSTRAAMITAARDLIRAEQVRIVLVSLGGNGCILVTADQVWFADALPVTVRGTVGAGDSMLAGFVHSLANARPLNEALAWATACGALAVSKTGTEAFGRDEVEVLARQVRIRSALAEP